MQFDNSFEVALPPPEAWALLMDIQHIAPCMPGAKLTEVIDPRTYRGEIAVRLGPVALTFAGTVHFEELDDTNHTARVRAEGRDAKGRGGAHAITRFHIEPTAAGSKVLVHTDLTLSGAVAQYGRGVGIIQSTAAQLMKQFAAALRTDVIERGAPEAEREPAAVPRAPARADTPPAAAKPISGFSLLVRAIWDAIMRLFTRERRQ